MSRPQRRDPANERDSISITPRGGLIAVLVVVGALAALVVGAGIVAFLASLL